MAEHQPSEKKPDGKTGKEKPADAPPKKELTPEEQMEAYEKDLKENDWGHQPC